MNRLRKFLELPSGERRLLLRAWLWLWVMRGAFWVLPFPLQKRLIFRVAQPPAEGAASDPANAEQVAKAVARASGYVPRATCLIQALAGQVLLKQRGVPARLYIGVAKDEQGRFQAHAWVESQGRVLLGASDKEYAPMLALDKIIQ